MAPGVPDNPPCWPSRPPSPHPSTPHFFSVFGAQPSHCRGDCGVTRAVLLASLNLASNRPHQNVLPRDGRGGLASAGPSSVRPMGLGLCGTQL